MCSSSAKPASQLGLLAADFKQGVPRSKLYAGLLFVQWLEDFADGLRSEFSAVIPSYSPEQLSLSIW